MTDKEKEKPVVKISMQQMCMTCMMHSLRDMQGSECAPNWVYCRLWNELKYGRSVCPNYNGGA